MTQQKKRLTQKQFKAKLVKVLKDEFGLTVAEAKRQSKANKTLTDCGDYRDCSYKKFGRSDRSFEVGYVDSPYMHGGRGNGGGRGLYARTRHAGFSRDTRLG